MAVPGRALVPLAVAAAFAGCTYNGAPPVPIHGVEAGFQPEGGGAWCALDLRQPHGVLGATARWTDGEDWGIQLKRTANQRVDLPSATFTDPATPPMPLPPPVLPLEAALHNASGLGSFSVVWWGASTWVAPRASAEVYATMEPVQGGAATSADQPVRLEVTGPTLATLTAVVRDPTGRCGTQHAIVAPAIRVWFDAAWEVHGAFQPPPASGPGAPVRSSVALAAPAVNGTSWLRAELAQDPLAVPGLALVVERPSGAPVCGDEGFEAQATERTFEGRDEVSGPWLLRVGTRSEGCTPVDARPATQPVPFQLRVQLGGVPFAV